jgi:hypothetical protein
MNRKDLIIQELDQVPELLLEEVLDYLRFLKVKHLQEKSEASNLSESSVQKEWLRSDEDEAWQNS